jgi:hypothetical protein
LVLSHIADPIEPVSLKKCRQFRLSNKEVKGSLYRGEGQIKGENGESWRNLSFNDNASFFEIFLPFSI